MADVEPAARPDVDTDPQAPVAWSVGWPLLGFVCGIIGSLLAGGVAAGIVVVFGGEPNESLAVVIASMVGLWTGYALIIFATMVRYGGRPVVDLGLRARPVDVAIGAGVGLASWIGSAVIYLLLDAIGLIDLDDIDNPARELADLARGPSFALLFLFVVIGAPIVEEVYFRGFLQPTLVRNLRPLGGVALTAIVFGVSHFQPLQTIGLVAFGGVLGVLAHVTRRLGPSIATHMVFNGLTMITLLLAPQA